jgi:uncharacterized protein
MSTPIQHGNPQAWKLSQYAISSSAFPVTNAPPQRVLFSTRSTSSLLVADSVWDATVRGRWELLPPDVFDVMRRDRFVVPDKEDELHSVLTENTRASAEATELVQVIQPSAACQLGCFYCGQDHSSISLAEHRQDALLRRIKGRLNAAKERGVPYHDFNVGWFGAEPLLGMKAIRRLSPKLLQLAEDFQCDYSARIITNGIRLTPALARELYDTHAVSYIEITLDGTQAQHDLRRFTKAGKGSFDKIFENLKAVAADQDLKFELVIRSNVDASNADQIPELIDLLADNGIHQRAKLYFSPVYSWGNDAHAGSLPPEIYAERETEWFAQMLRRGYVVDLLPSRHPVVCLAVQRGARVTDAFGTEFNCTEVPYVPAYGTPNSYAVGDVEDEADPVSPLFFQSWYEDIAESKYSSCASCRILPVCGGACPKAWHDGNPPCPSTKLNIEDRMLLNLAAPRFRHSGD